MGLEEELEAQRKAQSAFVEERLSTTNEVYTQGPFCYLRMLLHTLGLLQFAYGIYYHWFKVHWPQYLQDEEELKMRWGGKFKYLAFLDVILQALYHLVALLNDLIGSNAVGPPHLMPGIRILRDYMFAAWAFPIAHNVCIPFWVIYTYDRELIFPSALDAIFPKVLHHIVHTNVVMFIIADIFTCFRQYPSRAVGLTGTIVFMGHWVYPLLEVLNLPMRCFMLGALLAFTVFCYFLGEFLNTTLWSTELYLLRMKHDKTA